MRIRRKAKRRQRRTFTLQMHDRPKELGQSMYQPTHEFEWEAKLLDTFARHIDGMLKFPVGSCSIRHDQDSFTCYIGESGVRRALIVRTRDYSALGYTVEGGWDWCKGVANEWLELGGLPPLEGNHPPRPVETRQRETASTVTPGADDGQQT